MQTIIISNNNKTPYKPEGLDRFLWLASKEIAIADAGFSPKDYVRFAMALYSGAYPSSIRVSDMVDCVINALARYYQHVGVREWELRELFNPLRTDYATLTG